MEHGTVLTVFVVIAAIALAIQAAMLTGLFLIAQKIHRQVSETGNGIKRQVDLMVEQALELVAISREPIRTITANIAEVSCIIRERTGQLDGALDDLTERSRLQLARADQLIGDLIAKVEATANTVQRGVVSPLREAFAVVKGVQTALDLMFSRRRSSTVDEATQDDEMFI